MVVFGEDPIIGRALELLLRSVGYDARFLTEASLDKPGLLDEVQLLLFARGGMDAERRDVSMSFLKSVLAEVPILELVSYLEGAQAETKNLVPWPCRAEELKRRIEAAYLAGPAQKEKEVRHG